MHPNEHLIRQLYEAFQRGDPDAMAACYRPNATFSDGAFPHLAGAEIGAMWRMLLRRGAVERTIFTDIRANETSGSGHWEAWYTFSGRLVHNRIDSRFTFLDGLIASHHDSFDFARWAGQALGWPGKVFGRLPMTRPVVQRIVQKRARRRLATFMRAS